MNPLTKNYRIEDWTEALEDRVLGHDLALIDEALYGLQTIGQLLVTNHTESQEEDKTESMELGEHQVRGLYAVVASLSTLAYLRMADIKARAERMKNADQ